MSLVYVNARVSCTSSNTAASPSRTTQHPPVDLCACYHPTKGVVYEVCATGLGGAAPPLWKLASGEVENSYIRITSYALSSSSLTLRFPEGGGDTVLVLTPAPGDAPPGYSPAMALFMSAREYLQKDTSAQWERGALQSNLPPVLRGCENVTGSACFAIATAISLVAVAVATGLFSQRVVAVLNAYELEYQVGEGDELVVACVPTGAPVLSLPPTPAMVAQFASLRAFYTIFQHVTATPAQTAPISEDDLWLFFFAIHTEFPNISVDKQEDAVELMNKLLEKWCAVATMLRGYAEVGVVDTRVPDLGRTVQCGLVSRRQCSCGHVATESHPHLVFHLPLLDFPPGPAPQPPPPPPTVRDLLDAFTAEQPMVIGKCLGGTCGVNVPGVSSESVTLGSVFIAAVSRFAAIEPPQQQQLQWGAGDKVTYKRVDAVRLLARETLQEGGGMWELIAVVHHTGVSIAAGHFTTHVKIKGKWYLWNDAEVYACTEAEVLAAQQTAYVLVYKRVG